MKKFLVTVTLLIAFLSLAFGQATDKSDKTRTALLKLTDQITTAKSHKDMAQLERLLTDEFMLTNPAGFVANKSEYLDGVKADSATYESVANSDQVVSIYDNAAVVTGSTVVKGRFEGHDIGGNFRFTNVLIRRNDTWQCAAMHLTRIAQQ